MENLILFGMPTGSEWIIILVIVLLLFGGRKIPELMKGLGKGVKMFKDGVNEAKAEIDDAAKELEKKDTEEKKTEK
ncbi:MAG: twin-arginine translocase TatA/TatE family subunit [Bacteroidaceae bacterium]|nr:twin-arginine translocase TatA/TatE family subunit [Bacteroidaceae bacterium]